MREYYARFFKEFRRQVFIFWKAQIAVSLSAGIIAAVANAVRQETPLAIGLISIAFAAIGYFVMLGIFSVCAIMCAPVKLDQERSAEINSKDVALHAEQSKVAAYEEALARKHPHNEHLEARVKEEIEKLDEHERDFVRCLMDHTRMNNHAVYMAGFNGVPDAVIHKTGHFLLTFDSIRTGNGVVERDRAYRLNEAALDSLRNVMYPSPRPGTPPSV